MKLLGLKKEVNFRELDDGIYKIRKLEGNILTLGYSHLLPGSTDPMLDQYEERDIVVKIDDRDLAKLKQEMGEIKEGRRFWMFNHRLVKVLEEDKSERNIKIRRKTDEEILATIARLEEEIDEYRSHDLKLPSVQDEIKSRREQVRAYCDVLSIPYDGKKYFSDWF